MTNRHDLILQLSKLTPTEGEWSSVKDVDFPFITIGDCSLDTDYLMNDDIDLITLAPQMRIEILAMAKEIEELEYEVKHLADPLMYPKNKFTKCEDCIHIACENHGKCIKPLII